MLGCDMLVSADSALLKLMNQSGHVVANTNEMPTGGFTRDTEERLPGPEMAARLCGVVDEGQATLIDTSRMAVRLLGDTIASNLLLLGVAWQKGLIRYPLMQLKRRLRLMVLLCSKALMPFAGVGNGLLMQVRLTGKLLQLRTGPVLVLSSLSPHWMISSLTGWRA